MMIIVTIIIFNNNIIYTHTRHNLNISFYHDSKGQTDENPKRFAGNQPEIGSLHTARSWITWRFLEKFRLRFLHMKSAIDRLPF